MNVQMQSKVIDFLNALLLTETSDFRLHVLETLKCIFKFQHLIFWEIDDSGNFENPVFINVEDSFMEEYQSYYYWKDVLNPHKVEEHLSCDTVLTVKDVMSLNDYENTIYYNAFMRQYNYYHEILIYLNKNTRLIGAIGIGMRSDDTLNIDDIKGLEVISKHISKTLAGKQLLDNMDYKNLIFKTSSEQLPIGMAIFDDFFNIIHINRLARNILLKLTPHNDTRYIQQFLGSFITHNFPSWQLGIVDTFITKNSDEISFHIIPESIKNKKIYILYLVPNSILQNKGILKDVKSYNLSERELEIVELVMKGYTNQDIANELFISLHTVKTHLQNIFKKVGVSNRTSLCYELKHK